MNPIEFEFDSDSRLYTVQCSAYRLWRIRTENTNLFMADSSSSSFGFLAGKKIRQQSQYFSN